MLLALVVEARQITAVDRARLEKALAAYNSGQIKEAEGVLQDLVQRYPDNFEVVETLGLIYAQRGELARALPWLEAAHKTNSSSPEAAANLGVAYLKLNRIDSAVTVLAQAVSLDPENDETQSTYGQALMMAKRPREAAQAFAVASGRNPDNADTLYNWALAAFDSGDSRQASTILARIPSRSRSAQMESLCGDVEESQKHFDLALACFQNAARLEPTEPNLNALGLELLKHWSFGAAAKVYEYSVAKYPSSSRLQTGLGIALYGDARYDEAAKVFASLLTSVPNQASYIKFLGQSCVAMKTESREDCGILLKYAQQHPTDAVAARLAAATILEQHDSAQFDLAQRLLERAIAQDPRSADGYYRMGVLDQERGAWGDSVTMLKQAAALDPKSSKTHLRLAVAYSHLEQRDQARREAVLQKQYRQSEDTDMEAKRKDLTTFILEIR